MSVVQGFILGAASLRRRRRVLGLGYAVGCCLLVLPAYAGILTPFANWGLSAVRSVQGNVPYVGDERHASKRRRGTLLGSSGAQNGDRAKLVDDSINRRLHEADLRRVSLRRRIAEAHVKPVYGDWSACSQKCTRTRTVLCATLDYKIVPDHLCGDELPPAEEHCEADACEILDGQGNEQEASFPEASTGTPGDARSSSPLEQSQEARTEADMPSVPPGEASVASEAGDVVRDQSPEASDPAPVERMKDSHETKSSKGEERKESGEAVDVGAAERASIAKSNTERFDDGFNEASKRQGEEGSPDASRPVSGATGVHTAPHDQGSEAYEKEPLKSESEASPAEGSGSSGRDGTEGNRDGASREGDGTEPNRDGDAFGAKQTATGHHGDARSGVRRGPVRTSTKDTEGADRGNINLSARPHTQGIERIGGGLGSRGERQRRSWLVLGIGVGAVGSFLAAVAFAVRQYREEQHRLRGLNALSDVPVDDYINPFCSKDYSEEERSAFKL